MYQNSFLDGLIGTPILLGYVSSPHLEEEEHVQGVQEGSRAFEIQKTGLRFFFFDAYDEIGIKGHFTDQAGQINSEERFIPWSAVLSIM